MPFVWRGNCEASIISVETPFRIPFEDDLVERLAGTRILDAVLRALRAGPVPGGSGLAESGHTLQGSFSAGWLAGKPAYPSYRLYRSKQASSFRPIHEKRKGTQANRAQLDAHDLILPVL